ncbi:hypothetical protein PCASD_04909 [Puccinia coronata f. sp. avenae]|uniref:Uncharacterized protein n=1 Tax=Puccinia coronata f. sp. avenae TaxID=200324 RepID=A0A2N5VD68_9BASI|nr:hypothetical protein PCASD_04909 [Puccinia coronata f. sp. avenae]
MPPLSPSPHPTPRTPSRQSSWAITPVQTDPNFVWPNQDSRKALVSTASQSPLVTRSASRRQPHSCTSPASTQKTATSNTKRKQKSKKRKVHVIESNKNGSDDSESDHSSAQAPFKIDIVQDSDQENSKLILL